MNRSGKSRRLLMIAPIVSLIGLIIWNTTEWDDHIFNLIAGLF